MVVSAGSGLETRSSAIARETLDAFRNTVTGRVVTSIDGDYDTVRQPFSIREDTRPLAIVEAADERDVAATVAFVREHSLPLTIRSGGHGLSASALINDSVQLDLKQMAQVSVDPVARTARIQPGATSAAVAAAAHEHGLAISTGDTGSVGFGGLGTGGGIGFMVRAFGLTIDNLLSARVVTADGAIHNTCAIENPDLFWAIRGGGSNFGVVTEFTVRLAPVDQILGGALILPATSDVLEGFVQAGLAAPDDLTVIGNVMRCPPMPFVAPEFVGSPVVAIFVCWTGAPEGLDSALAPIRNLAVPVADVIFPMPYPDIFKFTEMQSTRHAAHIRSMFADTLSRETLDGTIAAIENPASPFCIIQIRPLGGAMARVDPYATAFPHREQNLLLSILAVWFDPTSDGSIEKDWTERTWESVKADARGVYVNFLADEGPERAHEAYGKTTFDRLAQVKRIYDPENLFRHNQNISPAT